jgi:hypothetical protein
MVSIKLILYVAALVLFVLAATGARTGRFSVGWLGLACWLAADHLL